MLFGRVTPFFEVFTIMTATSSLINIVFMRQEVAICFSVKNLLLSAKHALEPKHTRFLVGQAPLERC